MTEVLSGGGRRGGMIAPAASVEARSAMQSTGLEARGATVPQRGLLARVALGFAREANSPV